MFSIDGDLEKAKPSTIGLNTYSLHKFANVLYIDSPLGTGFSQFSTDSSNVDNYAKQMFPANPRRQKAEFPGATQYVVKDVQDALLSFYSLFDGLRSKRLNIFALGYTAKMVPYLVKQNLPKFSTFSPVNRLNITTVVLGNPLVQPSLQYASYAKYGYVTGLTMYRQLIDMNKKYEQCLSNLESGNNNPDNQDCHGLIEGLIVNSGNVSPFDIREQTTKEYEKRINLLNNYVNNYLFNSLKGYAIKTSVNITAHCSKRVNDLFHEEYHLDLPQDIMPSILNERLTYTQNYSSSVVRFMAFSEQFNLVSNVFGVNEILRQMLDWEGQLYFNNVNAALLSIDGLVNGRFKAYGGLTQVILYNNNYKEGMQDNPNYGNKSYKQGVINGDMVASKYEMFKRFITRGNLIDSRVLDDRNNLCENGDDCHSSKQDPCPNKCSGKGTCLTDAKKCSCQPNFDDHDCSIGTFEYTIDQLAKNVSFPSFYIHGRDTVVLKVNIKERTSLLDIYLDVSRKGAFGTPFVFLNVSTKADALTGRELKLLAMRQIGYNLLNGYISTKSEAQASHAHYFFTGYKSFQFYNTSHEPKKIIDAQDVDIFRNEYHTIALVVYNSADYPVEFDVSLKVTMGGGKVQLPGIFLALSLVMLMVVVFEVALIYQRAHNRSLLNLGTSSKDIPLKNMKQQHKQRQHLLSDNNEPADLDEEDDITTEENNKNK